MIQQNFEKEKNDFYEKKKWDIEYIYFLLDHHNSLKHNICDLCLKEKEKQKSNQINWWWSTVRKEERIHRTRKSSFHMKQIFFSKAKAELQLIFNLSFNINRLTDKKKNKKKEFIICFLINVNIDLNQWELILISHLLEEN